MANYNNAKEQAQQTSVAVMKRLTQDHFALTEGVAQSLVRQGLHESQLPILASTCLAINVSPNLLRYNHNIPPIVRALKLVTQFGYHVGDDFHTPVFKTNVTVLNEDGEPTDEKADAPTVVIMVSAARIEANGKEDDRLTGLLHHVETSIVEDQGKAKKIFDDHFKNSKPFNDAVVAEARLYTYHRKSGLPIGSGEPQLFYGFYIPNYTYDGKLQKNKLESNKPKDNYEAPAVARKRATAKAWRAVTRNNYPRDDRPVDVRLAALMDTAQTKLAAAEHVSAVLGVDLETAIVDGDQLMEDRRKSDKRATAIVVKPEVDDFNALLMYGDDTPVLDGNNDVSEGEHNEGGASSEAQGVEEVEMPIDQHPGYTVFSAWKNMGQAHQWAVAQGVYSKPDDAKQEWIALVQAYGTYSADSKPLIHRDWFDFVTGKTEKVAA